ncbi:MAG: TonB-dependent receptor, partial [Hyphomicrobiaceae bacterium]
ENTDRLVAGPEQRSHVLSSDVTYDLNEYVSVGAKYGFRIGEVSTTRSSADFIRSSAHLGILRADMHIVKNWDALVEGRVLHTPEVKATDYGALFAVYRHVGENLKVGLGYNFGRFSDDITDLTHDDDGIFVNAIGKF